LSAIGGAIALIGAALGNGRRSWRRLPGVAAGV
jgi:hypothetical protein